jgi:hypothetical protein
MYNPLDEDGQEEDGGRTESGGDGCRGRQQASCQVAGEDASRAAVAEIAAVGEQQYVATEHGGEEQRQYIAAE